MNVTMEPPSDPEGLATGNLLSHYMAPYLIFGLTVVFRLRREFISKQIAIFMISEFWTFGLQNLFVRPREPFFSNLRTFGLKNLRTHEPSNLRTSGLMGCNLVVSSCSSCMSGNHIIIFTNIFYLEAWHMTMNTFTWAQLFKSNVPLGHTAYTTEYNAQAMVSVTMFWICLQNTSNCLRTLNNHFLSDSTAAIRYKADTLQWQCFYCTLNTIR